MGLIDEIFDEACRKLRASNETPGQVAKRTGLSKNTARDVLQGETTSHQVRTKADVIAAVFESPRDFIYSSILGNLEMTPAEHMRLEHYTGEFRYVRKASWGAVVSGTLLVEKISDRFVFHHTPEFDRSQKVNKNVLHSGSVFLLGSKLTFLGIGSRYLREMVAIDHDSPQENSLTGIALTMDTASSEPMASVFYLAHQSYGDFDTFVETMRHGYEENILQNQCNMTSGLLMTKPTEFSSGSRL